MGSTSVKAVRRTLMKLSPGVNFIDVLRFDFYQLRSQSANKALLGSEVNFINFLQPAFAYSDPESAKKTVKLSVFVELLGYERAKAAQITLMK